MYPAGPGGGTYTFLLKIVHNLKKTNKVAIAHFGNNGSGIFEGVPVFKLSTSTLGYPHFLLKVAAFRALASMGSLLRLIRELKVDMLFPQGPASTLLCGLVSKISCISSVPFVHGLPFRESYIQKKKMISIFLGLLIFKIGLSLSTCILVASNFMKEQVSQKTGVQVRVVPLGVDIVETPILYMKTTVSPVLHILYLGRLAPEKGVDVILKALKYLRDLPVTLTIIGTGPWENKIKKLATELDICTKLSFEGTLSWDEVESKMYLNDIAVVPSRYEPFGLVALEAMAHGLPVIASRVDGLKEIVQEGIDGFFFEPEDYMALCNLFKFCALSPDHLMQMRFNALRRAQMFTWIRTALGIQRVFEIVSTRK
jgi:glycosyltransferase involved in cell wall biosynthesis